ncbi:MAG: ankyrin repeat domain-containing protein [Candidatus Micrarchaeia archaeon]
MAIAVKQSGKEPYRPHALVVNARLASLHVLVETIKAIDRGMPANSGDWKAALDAAAKSGDRGKFDLLAEKAKPDANTLINAATGGSVEIVERILSNLLKSGAGAKPSTLLHAAVTGSNHLSDREKLVKMLLESGADPNAVNPSGHTPLSLALLRLNGNEGHRIAEELVRRGAGVKNVEPRNLRPLISALEELGSNPVFKPLLDEARGMMKQV